MVAQVTGITAKEYRRIQGSIRNHALIDAGEDSQAERSFAKAERASRTDSSELDKLLLMPLDTDGRLRLPSVIDETILTLKLIGLQVQE